ncbi:hypothetical protein CPter291_3499 [Collimonas pratensis]|uniref:Uncharacterized protein n=1 Tax=Collimonas pratensis TaxID=279113 RepID=A0ABM5ZA09_9BURK|nr:hypothetical protein CPter291_3499 [Collimonas pratensis]
MIAATVDESVTSISRTVMAIIDESQKMFGRANAPAYQASNMPDYFLK